MFNLSRLNYVYDNDDNITGITDVLDASKTVSYAYDAVGRLSRVDVPTGALRRTDYAHDQNGNRTSVTRRTLPTDATPAETDSYTRTAGTNRLASISDANGVRTISYDARGNMATETRPGSISVATTYDGFARLTSYTRTGEAGLAHAYNGLDDRVATTRGTDTRRYVYDMDGRVIGEYGTSATDVKAEFIWLSPEVANDNQPFGGDDGTGGYAPLAVATGPTATPTLTWAHGNHLGVPIVYTDATGTATTTPAGYDLPGFPGQSRTLADLYYNRYRDYDTTTGRYIQADPIGLAGGPSPYSYAMNNPVRYTDPDGLNPTAFRAAFGAGELIGEGLFYWCTRNPALCMRTIGPAAIRVGKAIDAIAKLCEKGDNDNHCDPLYREITRLRNELTRRLTEFRVDEGQLPETGRHSRAGHAQQFRNKQAQLRSLLQQADAKGCKNYELDAWYFATVALDRRY